MIPAKPIALSPADSNSDVYRDFFVFNVPALAGQMISARRDESHNIQTPKGSRNLPGERRQRSRHLVLADQHHGISTPWTWTDGSGPVADVEDEQFVSFNLNGAALTAITAAAGSNLHAGQAARHPGRPHE